jgi:uncharacterized Zn-binding protein involved in type VI secretion
MFTERTPGRGPAGPSADRLRPPVRTLVSQCTRTVRSGSRTVHVLGAPAAHSGSRWPAVLNGGGDR